MRFISSKLLLATCWTLFTLMCFMFVADFYIGLSNGLRTQAVGRVQSSTPIMDCDPEIAACSDTPLPKVDEFTDVTLPALAIMAVLAGAVSIACLYRPDSKK